MSCAEASVSSSPIGKEESSVELWQETRFLSRETVVERAFNLSTRDGDCEIEPFSFLLPYFPWMQDFEAKLDIPLMWCEAEI